MNPIDILKIKLKRFPKMLESLTSEEIALAIEESEQSILNYCNRDLLPKGLYYVCADIAKDLLTIDYLRGLLLSGEGLISLGTGESIKVGRVEVKDSTNIESLLAKFFDTDDLMEIYVGQLNKFRVLTW